MRIRFLTSCSTDGPSFAARHVYDLADDFAAGFVRAGLAVPAEAELEKAPAVAVETATAPAPAVETATQAAPAAPHKSRRNRN